MCAVCRRALNIENGRYIHPAKDEPVSHDPVPIAFGVMPALLRCDFCSAEHPTKLLPARTFQTPIIGAGSLGNWACCSICAGFIEKGMLESLISRAVETAPPELRKLTGIRKLYRALYSNLQDNITGPLRDL